jgi:predicted DNA-binding ribbon-helix-helix protein
MKKSLVLKRSIVIAGHKTSVSLEEPFWTALKEAAAQRRISVSDLVAEIETNREYGNLSSAIRLFVLGLYRGEIEHFQSKTGGVKLRSGPAH